MKIIKLTQGKETIVDDEDFEMLSRYGWCYDKTGYVKATIKRRQRTLHQVLIAVPSGMTVDHKNGDPLDNRRSNLRVCRQQQQMWNTRKCQSRPTSSKYKGVCWSKHFNCWKGSIRCNDRQNTLGWFYDEVDAALAYDQAATKLFGEFARLNFPDPSKAIRTEGLSRCPRCSIAFKNEQGVKMHFTKVHGAHARFGALTKHARTNPEYWAEGARLDFTEALCQRLDKIGMTHSELSQRSGVSKGCVSQTFRHAPNLTIETMTKMAMAAGMEMNITLKPLNKKFDF